jgi:hypothetical protein
VVLSAAVSAESEIVRRAGVANIPIRTIGRTTAAPKLAVAVAGQAFEIAVSELVAAREGCLSNIV